MKKISDIQKKTIEFIINSANIKAVEKFNIDKKEIKYSSKIKSSRDITSINGDEEIARAFLVTELVNVYGYKPENLELETVYTAGRPHTNTSRIDLVVRDDKKDAFLFVEIKSPDAYEQDDLDQDIEEQLYKVAGMEQVEGHNVKYLVLYSIDIDNINNIQDDCIVIDKEKFSSFNEWKEERIYGDEIPDHYGKTRKKPYIKGSDKDLETEFTNEMLNRLQTDLHNVLWGGGSTDDNEIFSSLTNIILAKIQDEDETNNDEQYKFQALSYENDIDETYESNDELFSRINELYRRALKNRLNIDDNNVISKSYVVDQNKFSLNNFTYKNIVFSKNKYRNIFILLSILVLCSALSVPLCQGLQESFKIAIDLVNMSMNQEVAKYALKSQTELYFRDVFLRIILILLFWTLLIFDVFMLVYSYALEKRSKKNKNIY